MPPLTTPFTDGGEVDWEALGRNVSRYNDTGLSGYVALGSNGEAVHLTTRERARVIETVKRAASPGMRIIGGVNEFSTQAAIEACRAAADAGAEAALVVTPYYYKSSMTQQAFVRHFTEVANRSPIPVIIYNVPQNTGVVIESPTVASLASHENIVGIKDSAGNMGAISETIRLVPERFAVLAGNGGILYPSVLMGARGAILAAACAAPRACVALFEAAASGDHTRARQLQHRVAQLSHAVTARFGLPGLKAVMDMLGYVGGLPRSPLLPLGAADQDTLKKILRNCGLFPELE